MLSHHALCKSSYKVTETHLERSLHKKSESHVVIGRTLRNIAYRLQSGTVGSLALLVVVHPFGEFSLFLLLSADDVQLFESLLLANPLTGDARQGLLPCPLS